MFYKVVLDGVHLGVDIRNTLYYRLGVGFDLAGITLWGADIVAEEVKQEVWDAAWKDCVSTNYQLQKISVYPIDDNFRLVYNMPYILDVQEYGKANGDDLSPAQTVNIKFMLEPQRFPAALITPKRGYLSVSGLIENFQENGVMKDEFIYQPLQWFHKLARKLSENLETIDPLPAIFYPVRIRQIDNPLSTQPLAVGYSDIKAAYVDPVLSWRKSRRLSG